MSCCGQKRAQLSTRPAAARGHAAVTTGFAGGPTVRARAHGVALRYIGRGALSVRVPGSGRAYHVPATGATLEAHQEDVEALLRLRVFARDRR